MGAKPESQLWSKLRDGTKDLGVFWTRRLAILPPEL
jgi:hypothetical protein